MFLKKYLSVNGVTLKEFPFRRELAMEAFLIENEDVLALPQFDEVSIEDCEIHVPNGSKLGDKNGRLDILATYGREYAAVIELKAEEISANDVLQLQGYLAQSAQLEQILAKNQVSDANYDQGIISQQGSQSNENFNQGNGLKWLGVLVGTSIDPDFARDLRKGIIKINEVPVFGMTLNRYRDDSGQVFVITDIFMPPKVVGKDYTKYKFEGKTYTKGKLVLAVIRSYLRQNSATTFDDLAKHFPPYLQGGFGVFASKDDAESIVQRSPTGHKRHFIGLGDILKTGDGQLIAVCNQWGKGNIRFFIKKASEHNFVIEEVSG